MLLRCRQRAAVWDVVKPPDFILKIAGTNPRRDYAYSRECCAGNAVPGVAAAYGRRRGRSKALRLDLRREKGEIRRTILPLGRHPYTGDGIMDAGIIRPGPGAGRRPYPLCHIVADSKNTPNIW